MITPTVWSEKYSKNYNTSFLYSNFFYSKIKNKKKTIKLIDYGNDNAYKTMWQESKKHCTTNATAIDIGCRDGEFTRYLSRTFDKIYCFDYRKRNQFCMNVDVRNNKIFHFACPLGAEQTKEKASGRGNFRATKLDPKWRHYKPVQIYPLDFFHIKKVSLIKIDVDGMEEEVIKGAMKTIKKSKPVIIIEQLISNGVCNHNGVELLEQMGYTTVHQQSNTAGNHNDLVLIPAK